MDMLTEMRASKDGACVDAYNAILRLVPFMREKSEPRWELIQVILYFLYLPVPLGNVYEET